jgi:hypothetical protein
MRRRVQAYPHSTRYLALMLALVLVVALATGVPLLGGVAAMLVCLVAAGGSHG